MTTPITWANAETLVKLWKEADGLAKKGEPLPTTTHPTQVQAGFMIHIYGGIPQALEVVAGRLSRDPAFWVEVRAVLEQAASP